jgi:hypothetical protein
MLGGNEMELDRDLINQIHAMDDASLALGIEKIAKKFGVDPLLAQHVLGDISKVKEAVANLNQQDLDRITQALGPETAEKLAQDIRREVQR